MYGLRQADIQWGLRLSRALRQKTDMEQSRADPFVFLKLLVDGEVPFDVSFEAKNMGDMS